MKKIIFFLIIFTQLLTIAAILKDINKKAVLGTTNVNPIQKDTLINSESEYLQYFYELRPDTVIKAEPIFEGLENVSYTINKDGLNQLEHYSVSKERGTYRIITVGDSYTFGANVNTQENYPSQLSNLLNQKLSCPTIKKFEVFNLGVGGYDIRYVIERLKLRGIKYTPDLVLWLVLDDDLTRINEHSIPKIRIYQEAAKKNGVYDQEIAKGNYYSEWIRAKKEVIDEIGEDNILFLQKSYLKDLNRFYNGNLIFFTFPGMQKNYQKIIVDFTQERKNTFFYNQLVDIYQIENATLPDLHPTKKGHTLIAKDIMEYLINKEILPCSINK